ncbi:MAG: FG-GAP-like repeat-containing protein [Thermoplasmata archaeon]
MRREALSSVGRILAFAIVLSLVLQFGFFTQSMNPEDGDLMNAHSDELPDTRGTDDPELLDSIDYLSDTVWIPQGGYYYVKLISSGPSLSVMRKANPLAGMPQEIIDAIDRSPNWLKDNITRKFEQLVDSDIDVGERSSPEFADLDNDGDLDLIVGSRFGSLTYFENLDASLHYIEGHDVFVAAVYKKNSTMFSGITGIGEADPAIGDVDGDGRMDLLIGYQNGSVLYYQNQGTVSVPVWAPPALLPGVSATSGYASVDLEDIDGNGYPDIILGEMDGTLHYFENEFGSFTERMIGLEWTDVGGYSTPCFSDMDDDGDFDITVGDALGMLHYFRNDTSNWTEEASMYQFIDVVGYSSPALVDLNLDLIPDLVLGDSAGMLHYYQNIGSAESMRWLLYQNTPTDFNFANHRRFYSENSSVYLRERNVPARALEYANYINTVPQRMLDELVFSIAHSATASLMNTYTWAEVWLNNTETLYYNDEYIEYANIVDYNLGTPDQYSTVEYWVDGGECCESNRYEYPPYIYYWYIVHPKGSDELPTYIDPSVKTSGHMGASPRPPAGNGTFWRWSVFNEADTHWPDDSGLIIKYPKEENPPLLKEHIAGVKYLWNGTTFRAPRLYENDGSIARNATGVPLRPWSIATHAVEVTSHWVESTLALNAQEHNDGNRPRQIARIQFEHNGNCGELGDLTLGAMRASLIPYIEVLSIAGDHCWGAFYERGWHQIDNYWSAGGSVIGDWDNYHYGWNWGSFITYRGDGAVVAPFPINETHRIYDYNGDGGADRGNVTVRVTDWRGNPVDGVRVSLADWNKAGIFGTAIGGAWYYTDSNGVAFFTTSETRQASMGDNNYDEGLKIHFNSRYGGGSPNPLYADRLIINVPGLNNKSMYYVNYTLMNNISRPYPLVSEGPPVLSPFYRVRLKFDTKVGIQHPANGFGLDEMSGGGVPYHDQEFYTGIHLDAFVVNETEFLKFLKGYPFEGYNITLNSSKGLLDFYAPVAGDWYLVLSNRDSVETTKLVEIESTLERFLISSDTTVLPPKNLNAQLSGPNLAYITLSWMLSDDDGGGENDIVRYDVYSSTEYDASGSGYQRIVSLPPGTTSYDVPSVGADHLNHFFYVTAVDDDFNENQTQYQIAKVAITVCRCRHLVSSILDTSGKDMAAVFQTVGYDQVWTYDSTDTLNPWKSSIPGKPINDFSLSSSLDRGKAYWLNVTRCGLLQVVGFVPSSTEIALNEGWNLVGYPSVNTTYTVADLKADTGAIIVEAADSLNSPYHLRRLSDSDTLIPGWGYWVYVPSGTIWTVGF